MSKKLIVKEFIQKAEKIHGRKYDYSKVVYVNSKIHIIIICPIHGNFLQVPNSHLAGNGCSSCSNKKKLSREDFTQRAQNVHGKKYDYSKVKYVNGKTKVIIICKQHGSFSQIPTHHILRKQGCPKCANNIKSTVKEFTQKAKRVHGNKYKYSKVKYVNCKTKVNIICKKHGIFLQSPSDHLSGRGCSECAGHIKLTLEDFIIKANKIHSNKYSYSKVEYANCDTKIIIICPNHKNFLQTPYKHLSGQGCPICSHKISESETNWLDSIEEREDIIIDRNPTIHIRGKRIFPDGFHKESNTIYEYYGYFWHGHPEYYNSSDKNPRTKTTYGELYEKTLKKEKLIKSAGYNLIVKWGN